MRRTTSTYPANPAGTTYQLERENLAYRLVSACITYADVAAGAWLMWMRILDGANNVILHYDGYANGSGDAGVGMWVAGPPDLIGNAIAATSAPTNWFIGIQDDLWIQPQWTVVFSLTGVPTGADTYGPLTVVRDRPDQPKKKPAGRIDPQPQQS